MSSREFTSDKDGADSIKISFSLMLSDVLGPPPKSFAPAQWIFAFLIVGFFAWAQLLGKLDPTVWLAIALFAFLFGAPRAARFWAYRRMERKVASIEWPNEQTLTFDRVGVRGRDDNFEGEWGDKTRLQETPNGLMVWVSSKKGYLIPTRAFTSEGDRSEFCKKLTGMIELARG